MAVTILCTIFWHVPRYGPVEVHWLCLNWTKCEWLLTGSDTLTKTDFFHNLFMNKGTPLLVS
jgi:hypothetical protein